MIESEKIERFCDEAEDVVPVYIVRLSGETLQAIADADEADGIRDDDLLVEGVQG